MNPAPHPAVIRPARLEDLPGILNVHRLAFPTPAEARLVELLHRRGKAAISLLAEQEGQVVGHVLFSSIRFEPPQPQILALGLAPVAVLPERQGRGTGSQLCRTGIEACRASGWQALVVLGDPAYYSRFGFRPASGFGLGNEYGVHDEFMALELQTGILSGFRATAKYAPEFQELDV